MDKMKERTNGTKLTFYCLCEQTCEIFDNFIQVISTVVSLKLLCLEWVPINNVQVDCRLQVCMYTERTDFTFFCTEFQQSSPSTVYNVHRLYAFLGTLIMKSKLINVIGGSCYAFFRKQNIF